MPTTLTATAEPTNQPPRIRLDLVWTGATSATAITIIRNDTFDGSQTPVREAEPITHDGAGNWTGYDYESRFGRSGVQYSATAVGGPVGGTILSNTVILTVTKTWLRHPGIPDLSQDIDFQGEGDPVRPITQAVLEPLGRSMPVVLTDGPRKSKRGTLTIRTFSESGHAPLLALLADATPLLLDIPPANSYGFDLEHQYLSLGDLTMSRLRPDYYPHPWRIWTVPYIVVDRPAGGLQSQRDYSDLLTNGTYQKVRTTYSTYTQLLTGV